MSSYFQITKSALILAIAIGSVSLASAQTTRTAYRDAYYAGAAATARAAVAAYYAPYYRPPACGYYPYPPCY